jgi:hypothetical protein
MLFSLLAEKRKELGDAAAKLRNGLDKIDETRAKVLNLRVYWPRRIFKWIAIKILRSLTFEIWAVD